MQQSKSKIDIPFNHLIKGMRLEENSVRHTLLGVAQDTPAVEVFHYLEITLIPVFKIPHLQK